MSIHGAKKRENARLVFGNARLVPTNAPLVPTNMSRVPINMRLVFVHAWLVLRIFGSGCEEKRCGLTCVLQTGGNAVDAEENSGAQVAAIVALLIAQLVTGGKGAQAL